MLATRGLTKPAVLENLDSAVQGFENSVPNPVSRAQYIRALLNYLSGLTDVEFADEYPTLTRQSLTDTLKMVSRRAGEERRSKKTPNAPDFT